MLVKFLDEQQRILNEVNQIFSGTLDTSVVGLAEIAAKQATVEMFELVNPLITTRTGEIQIHGRVVYALSAAQLKADISRRYPYERFPAVVLDYLKHGKKSEELKNMDRFEVDEVKMDLEALRSVCQGKEDRAIVFLSRLEPTISPVTEYITSGSHTSGIRVLRAIEAPFVIIAEGARFPFVSPEAKVTDGRTETNMVANLINFRAVINDVKNTVALDEEGKGKRLLRDALSILSIVLLALGLGLIAVRRGASVELGLISAVVGAIAFYFRWFSNWAKEYFAPGNVDVSGDAPVGLTFVGELR